MRHMKYNTGYLKCILCKTITKLNSFVFLVNKFHVNPHFNSVSTSVSKLSRVQVDSAELTPTWHYPSQVHRDPFESRSFLPITSNIFIFQMLFLLHLFFSSSSQILLSVMTSEVQIFTTFNPQALNLSPYPHSSKSQIVSC